MRALLLTAVLVASATAADLKPLFPDKGAKPIGPYVPGIAADDYVYVSGQGARDAAGNLPQGIEAQTRQCLNNVKDILSASGVGFENVVWAQVFLGDIKEHAAMNKVYAEFFPKNPPARSLIAVSKMPGETPVEIAVVAVKNLRSKKIFNASTLNEPVSQAVATGDRVYISGVLGIDAKSAVPAQPRGQVRELVREMQAVLAKTGLELRNLAYAHVYVDSAMPIKTLGDLLTEVLPSETAVSVVQTAALPRGAHVEISAVASRSAKRQGDCVSVGTTFYCAGAAGTIEQALQRVKDNLAVVGLDPTRVVVSNVFLDDIANFAAMNKVYGNFFGKWSPTRVTVQPTAKADELTLAPSTGAPTKNSQSPRAQVAVIAVR